MNARSILGRISAALLLCHGVLALAQLAAPSAATASTNPLDAVPEKMPWNTPYGAPITAQLAQSVISAAIAEATKRGWPLNVAVVDSGANLVAFVRMDGAQLASIAIAEHKARAAVKYRRLGCVNYLERSGSIILSGWAGSI
jgi:hypothetical protein